jgi:predicted DNA-binding antitoxin AbrB/MazE fold protein
MQETIETVYENGVFRPLKPVAGIADHRRVTITITSVEPHPLADCVGIMPDEDADEMRRIIQDEFERVDPDDWK